MRFLDALLGRTRPVKSRLEPLFALSTAYVTLHVNVGLETTGRAGICFRPLSSTRFEDVERELRQLVEIGARATETRFEFVQDDYGFRWIVLQDPDLEDLVAAMHMVSLTLQEHGFGEQLLAAVFKFHLRDRPVYWIYNYKRGAFYPLVPGPGERQRDNAQELRLRSLLERELPMEKDLERWYPMWGIPL